MLEILKDFMQLMLQGRKGATLGLRLRALALGPTKGPWNEVPSFFQPFQRKGQEKTDKENNKRFSLSRRICLILYFYLFNLISGVPIRF